MAGRTSLHSIVNIVIRKSLFLVLGAVTALACAIIARGAALKDGHSLFPVTSVLAVQTVQEATTLEPGKSIERELAGGQKHSYQIALSEGQYLRVEISQKGIDVGATFQLPNGRIRQSFEPFGGQPELGIVWVAESSGSYRIEVYAREKAPTGRYEIRLAEMRPATENDRALQQARNLLTEYLRLDREARYGEARTLLTKVLEIRERVLGPEDLLVATTLSFLASSCKATGDYASAEPLYLRALKIEQKALGPDHPAVALELTELGGLYLAKGDYLKAEEVDQRALGIYERAQLAEIPAVASLLTGLGSLCYGRGDYRNAEGYYERSRAVWEKLLGPEHFHLAPSYTHLGRVAYDAGDYPHAEAMFQRALTLSEKGLGQDHTSVTSNVNDLAMVYSTTGDYERSEALYRRALSVHERKAAMGHPAVQETLYGLARCFAAQGRSIEAVKVQARASEIEERYVALNLSVGSEREKLAFLDSLTQRSSRNISLHTRLAAGDPMALSLAVTTILQGKGRLQDAMSANLAGLRQRFGAEDQKLLDELSDVSSKLAKLVLKGPQKETPADRQERIKTLEEQREGIEAEISRRSGGFYERSQPVSLAAVQAAIPDDAALIELAIYSPFDPKAPDNQSAYGEPQYVAYIIRNHGEVRWTELGAAKEIGARVDALRQALRDPQRKDALQLARAVDEKVMRPVRALLGDATHLLISPDGVLNLVPFEALVDEQERYLIERYSITYLTSGRDLLRLHVARESQSKPLVIANPFFGEPVTEETARASAAARSTAPRRRRRSVTEAGDLSEVYFAPLGGTAQEAHAIKMLFPEATVLTQQQASESALKRVIAPSILHIATHGFFLEDSGTLAAGNATAVTRSAGVKVKIENPLLRSGSRLPARTCERATMTTAYSLHWKRRG